DRRGERGPAGGVRAPAQGARRDPQPDRVDPLEPRVTRRRLTARPSRDPLGRRATPSAVARPLIRPFASLRGTFSPRAGRRPAPQNSFARSLAPRSGERVPRSGG